MKSEKCAGYLRLGYVRVLLYAQIIGGILFCATATRAQSGSSSEDSFSSINLSAFADSSGVLALTGTNMLTLKSWSDDELTILIGALGEVSTVPMSLMPTNRWGGVTAGTFWSLQNVGMPPVPVNAIGVDVWPMSDGSFLLDDLDFEYGGFSAERSMMSVEFPFPGGGTNFGTPEGLPTGNYDYGTNLWIAQTAVVSNRLTGIGSNTLADVEYEIQSRTNLMQSDWQSEGFIVGSELTNWTPLSLNRNNRTTLFIRLKSWLSSDGSGLPDWWELQYFGALNIDPYGNPKGDGYNNLYKFQHGMNPNVFYTPAPPQNFKAIYNPLTGAVSLTWLPSPGAVTGYVLYKTDYQGSGGGPFSLTSNSLSYIDSIAGDTPHFVGPLLYVDYTIEAVYGTNGFSGDALANLEFGPRPQASLISDAQGRLSVVMPNPPNDLSNVWIYREKNNGLPVAGNVVSVFLYPYYSAIESLADPSTNGTFAIPASFISNGVFQLPDSIAAPYRTYGFWLMTVRSNGFASSWTQLSDSSNPKYSEPFADARRHLKDNLRFLIRSSSYTPFTFSQENNHSTQFTWPFTNFIYSGFYGDGGNGYNGSFNPLEPFEANAIYRNFVFDSNLVGDDGFLNTGCYGGYWCDSTGVYPYPDLGTLPCLLLSDEPSYLFDLRGFVTNSSAVPSSLLNTNQTQWLLRNDSTVEALGGTFTPGDYNFYELTNASVKCAYQTNGQVVIGAYFPGDTLPSGVYGVKYFQAAQPSFVHIDYYFADSALDALPEESGFSLAYTTPPLLQGVGTSKQYAGYEMLGFNANFAYLGQYFTNAFMVGTNGTVTTNSMGILSPYGHFYATQPGQVDLITMPDIDTGRQGTCTVSCVSMQVDKNHDGKMDFAFNGPDTTSANSPMIFWVNNDHDEPVSSGLLNTPLDSDKRVDSVNPPDCNYGYITSRRGLEDFARLWICGIPSLSADQYAITLSCASLSGSPAINLYAAESGGGIGYLTNVTVGDSLVNQTKITTISAGNSYNIPTSLFNGGNKYFLFEGTNAGTARLTLTINRLGSTIAQTSIYVDFHDIKDLYEQAHISNIPTGWNWPEMADSPRTSGFQVDHYVPPQLAGPTNQIFVFVHGWRMPLLEYYNFSETMFKRLYWTGFQGEFAALRWPTFSSDTVSNLQDYLTFNRSECVALQCGNGAAAYFTNLADRFTNWNVSVCSHSQGADVVASALRQLALAGKTPIRNYAIMQGAFTAQSYDAGVTNDSNLVLLDSVVPTPNSYVNYAAGISNAVQGRIVNLFNPLDFALALWYQNELFFIPQTNSGSVYFYTMKPDVFWGYQTDGSHAWLTNNFPAQLAVTTPRSVTNLIELLPFVARARCLPVGWQAGVQGPITGEFNLANQLGFTSAYYDHSGEFNHAIQDTQGFPYYVELLKVLISGQP